MTSTNTQHIITPKLSGRVEIKCARCGDSMEVDGSTALGQALLEQWPKAHKCAKGRRSK